MEDNTIDITEIDELRQRLQEAEAVIEAIRQGGSES
jgi:hypothetical protein